MTNIRRFPSNGAPVFITAVCRNRSPYLQAPSSKHLLLDIMREVKGEAESSVTGYVILDDHFHWLLTTRSRDISSVMQSVKLRFTRRLADLDVKPVDGSCWQPRFWDHIIRDQRDFNRHLDYIHYNPVKHGYVRRPIDYEFSSFAAHVEKRSYEKNWGAEIEPEALENMEFE